MIYSAEDKACSLVMTVSSVSPAISTLTTADFDWPPLILASQTYLPLYECLKVVMSNVLLESTFLSSVFVRGNPSKDHVTVTAFVVPLAIQSIITLLPFFIKTPEGFTSTFSSAKPEKWKPFYSWLYMKAKISKHTGRREGGKAGRREGGKAGRREGGKAGRKVHR